MHQDRVQSANGDELVPFDPAARVEQQNDKTLALRVE